MRKIVITGGHLTPSLLVIEELQKRSGWEIFYLGRKYATEGDRSSSLEAKIILQKGVNFLPLNAGRLQQKFTRYTFSAFLRIPFGFLQAFFYLLRIKPNIVLSFGSYVSVPVVFSAWLLKIPVIIHQQTLVMGKADKINTKYARKIAVSWPESLNNFPKEKVILTGNPLRPDLFKTDNRFLDSLNLDKNLPLILVTGGNQGSHRINSAVEGVLKKLLDKYNIFHQTGNVGNFHDFERLTKIKDNLPSQFKNRYYLSRFTSGTDWTTFLNKADLVISRAGINTLSELIALNKPCLLIPIPWLFNNEQNVNAQMMKKLGLAEIINQDDLSPEKLYQKIIMIMSQIKNYQKTNNKTTKLINLEAAVKIVNELEKLV
ncbi:MAG: UDP-N-acetylglucosamine--N-acetylmuramyl-(pentapeptide) pyrophosphoryl-undecaprenol N-acetylglucosamine transferase [Candidatus Shapirobacteria bacterium]|nr:UDP-N-acetylglucosamine--N-acetylmuramyl-(pentapeptide) pyrophosphoryl-undecaprenol N-acetylglucosamine transferase [Candidatus Shapirobacteria bacterium]